MSKQTTRHKKKFQPIPVRPDSNGELYEQLARLCVAWDVDRSKAIRLAVAEADARLSEVKEAKAK